MSLSCSSTSSSLGTAPSAPRFMDLRDLSSSLPAATVESGPSRSSKEEGSKSSFKIASYAQIAKFKQPQNPQALSKEREKEEEIANIEPDLVIENSHEDDIHGFLSLSENSFASGSKDNTIKMWSKKTGKLEQVLIPSESEGGYRSWVTALAKINENIWSCGTRDGRAVLWDFSGKEVAKFRYSPNAKNICKERNKTRINCIAALGSSDRSKAAFYTGVPENVYLWEHKVGTQAIKCIRRYFAKENDWVYCIEVLENRDLLVVIGSDFEYWKMKGLDVAQKFSLIEETREKKKQRPHISAITRLAHNSRHVALALFDGSVKIIDMDRSILIRDYREHWGRVWSVLDLFSHVFASSADDKTIKIWDARQEKSCWTLGGNPGRVSSLAKLSDYVFISGSCPDNIKLAGNKASISFWDIRHVAKQCKITYEDPL